MKKLMYISVAFATFLLASCGGSSNQSSSNEDSSATEASAANDQSATPASNTIDLTGNDQMQFNATSFTVKAGQQVTLHLKNVGTLPAAAMSHDVVILPPGSDYTAFGQAATQARDLDKLSADLKDKMIAHTKMLGPGEEDTITFTLTDPGEYVFLCSFPGHYATMHGTITAE